MIEIAINGTPRQFAEPLDVANLIEHLELSGKRIAVELNGDIVPRSQFSNTPLSSGDMLEIVVAVGGG